MIDVYSIDRLLEEGRLFKTERSSWYFDKANRVLIFPTPEEALNFSGKFGGYVFHTENLQILSETKVVMKQPSSNIQEHQFRRVNPQDAAATIRALVDGYCLQWLLGPEDTPIEVYRDRCRAVLGAYLLR